MWLTSQPEFHGCHIRSNQVSFIGLVRSLSFGPHNPRARQSGSSADPPKFRGFFGRPSPLLGGNPFTQSSCYPNVLLNFISQRKDPKQVQHFNGKAVNVLTRALHKEDFPITLPVLPSLKANTRKTKMLSDYAKLHWGKMALS